MQNTGSEAGVSKGKGDLFQTIYLHLHGAEKGVWVALGQVRGNFGGIQGDPEIQSVCPADLQSSRDPCL